MPRPSTVVISSKPKLLFLVTEDWYFCSHRLSLASAAIEAGFEVVIATHINQHAEIIKAQGIEVYPWNIDRGSTSISSEIKALAELFKIYRQVKPDIVHQVALKPTIYGSVIAKLTGPKNVINALGGMGSIFNTTSTSRKKKILQFLIFTAFKWLISGKNKILILQNPEDRELIINSTGIDPQCIRLIRGAGVNIRDFYPTPEPQGLPLVILPARMLRDKGVEEFVKAVQILKSEGIKARFALVGGIDECNPTHISHEQLQAWNDNGIVEWFGLCENMSEVLRNAHIVCLPSYREGLPKALLEAASCGRAIIATDVPGCREIVRDGENGILVPVRDPAALAQAIKKLILNPDLRTKMGITGRLLATTEFSEELVINQTINIYHELLGINQVGKPADKL